MWSAGNKKGCGQQGKRDMVSRSLWKQAPGLAMQLPGKGRPQGGALGGRDGNRAGRISASPPGQGQPIQFSSPCVPISLEEPLQNKPRSCCSLPSLPSPLCLGCAQVRGSCPSSVSCPSSGKELPWGEMLHTQTHLGTLLAKPLLATDLAQEPKGKA